MMCKWRHRCSLIVRFNIVKLFLNILHKLILMFILKRTEQVKKKSNTGKQGQELTLTDIEIYYKYVVIKSQ